MPNKQGGQGMVLPGVAQPSQKPFVLPTASQGMLHWASRLGHSSSKGSAFSSSETMHIVWVMKTPCEFLTIHRQSKKVPRKLIYCTRDKIIDFNVTGTLFFWLIVCPKLLWKILNTVWQTHTLHCLSYNPIVQTLAVGWKLWDLSAISVTRQALFCLI